MINRPLRGSGQENAACKNAEHYPADQTENIRSLGILVTFGKLRILDLGDLTRDKEMELVLPEQQTGSDRCLYRFSPWLVSERQPCVFECDRPSRRNHGQRSQEGWNAFGVGHY